MVDQLSLDGFYQEAEAARRLGLAPKNLCQLAYHGGLPLQIGQRKSMQIRWYPIEQGETPTTIYEKWVASVEEWDFEASYRHKRIRRALGIPFEYPQPEGLDDMARRALGPSGYNQVEIAAIYTEGPKVRTFHRNRLLERDLAHFANPDRLEDDTLCTLALVAHRFPRLKRLPETCFDADSEDASEPELKLLAKAMKLHYLPEFACCMLLLTAGQTTSNVEDMLNAVILLDSVLPERTMPGDVSAGEIVTACHLLLERDGVPQAEYSAAVEAVRKTLIMLRVLSIYAGRHPKALSYLKKTVDLPKRDNVALRIQCAQAEKLLGDAYRRNRSARVAKVIDNLDLISDVASLRHDQIVSCQEAIESAIYEALNHFRLYDERAPGDPIEPFFGLSNELEVIDERGTYVAGASQYCDWRIWRTGDFWQSLPHETLAERDFWGIGNDDMARLRKACGYDSTIERQQREGKSDNSLTIEFVGVRSRDGGPTHLPWFVQLIADNVTAPPTQLCGRDQQRRRATITALNLPEVPGGSGALFGRFEARKGLSVAASIRGRVILSVLEMAMGARYAKLALDGFEETLCRIGELLQMEQHPHAWTANPVRHGSAPSFKAVPKGRDEHAEFEVSEQFYAAALALARRSALSSSLASGYLPYVDPSIGVAIRLPEPRPIIFQFNGSAIEMAELIYLTNLLLMGVARVSPHLFRHAHSNRYRRMGVPERVLRHKMKHKSVAINRYYSKDTPRQVIADALASNEAKRSATRQGFERLRKVKS